MDACARAEKLIKEIREVWFPEHEISFHHVTAPENAAPGRLLGWTDTVHWKKPGTGVFAMELIVSGPTLYISGDLGGAVYRWSQDVHWVQFNRFNLDYFAEKCIASEDGREFVEWDSDVALGNVLDQLKMCDQDSESSEASSAWDLSSGPGSLESKFEWDAWLRSPTEADDIFGPDWQECLPRVGDVFSVRCIAHWVATRMVAEKLQERE